MKAKPLILAAISFMFFIGTFASQFEASAQDIDDSVEVYDESPEVKPDLSPENEPIPELDPKSEPPAAKAEPVTPPPAPVSETKDPTVDMKDSSDHAGLVEVEPTYAVTSDVTGALLLVPYKLRRDSSGGYVSLSYSAFEPSNYEPHFVIDDFDTIYGSAEGPLLELSFTYKWNFALGSLGVEFGGGFYSNTSDDEALPSTLTLIPVHLGAVFTFDNFMYEPLVAPYFGGGVYTIIFKESLEAVSFNGTTQAAPYAVGGLLFQLNWVDKISARTSYIESGVENTFLFAEGRMFMASGAEKDPDFSTDPFWAAGLKVEF